MIEQLDHQSLNNPEDLEVVLSLSCLQERADFQKTKLW